jgi:hypothetical protein
MIGTTMSSPGSSFLESTIKGLPMSCAPGTVVGNAILEHVILFPIPAIIGAMKDLDTTGQLTGTPYQVFGTP